MWVTHVDQHTNTNNAIKHYTIWLSVWIVCVA
jgi:hypothetical protein